MNTVKQYKQISLQAKVNQATPYELTYMLLEHAINKIELAIHALNNNDIPNKVVYINKVIDIVENLNASLNYEINRKLCSNVNKLYQFILFNLVLANSKNSINNLLNAKQTLQAIFATWCAIKP